MDSTERPGRISSGEDSVTQFKETVKNYPDTDFINDTEKKEFICILKKREKLC